MPSHAYARLRHWLKLRHLAPAIYLPQNAENLTADRRVRLKRYPAELLFKALNRPMNRYTCQVRLQIKIPALLDAYVRVARPVTDRIAAKFDRHLPNVADELPLLFEERVSGGGDGASVEAFRKAFWSYSWSCRRVETGC